MTIKAAWAAVAMDLRDRRVMGALQEEGGIYQKYPTKSTRANLPDFTLIGFRFWPFVFGLT
jgi:hypothetical protein